MKVRWSSTFVMLHRVLDLKEVRGLHHLVHITNELQEVNTFVARLGTQERDSERHHKIYELQLNDAEWNCVHQTLTLLVVRTTLLPSVTKTYYCSLSMLRMLNKHSRANASPLSTPLCQRLKHSTKCGPPVQPARNIASLVTRSRLDSRNYQYTTTIHQVWMHTYIIAMSESSIVIYYVF